ncbi:flagellar FliJ family protein [Hippea alviniae]|uniref:flagellar FliJ family protein n=1 Tax=Hippea alviniae TaxID=1279027 RepID=UPI0003B5C81D|nr:flagellar FliJ family protein [Hippea alviniae]
MFVFKFEKLLKIKSKLLDEKRLQIARFDAKIKEKEAERDKLLDENNQRRKKIFEILTSKRPDSRMIMFLNENVEKTDVAIKVVEFEIEMLKKEKEKLIKEAAELLKEKKKLEKLKEKKFEEFKEEISKKEMRFLDEIASVKVASKLANGS